MPEMSAADVQSLLECPDRSRHMYVALVFLGVLQQ